MFGQLLIDPVDSDLLVALEAALRDAAPEGPAPEPGAALSYPPEMREELPGIWKVAEGWQVWPLTRRFTYGRVGVAWWTDPTGRRHYRVGGAGYRTPAADRFFTPFPGLTPLARVHPERSYLRTVAKESRLIVVCDCGMSGAPGDLAWMGPCCGPCYDRWLEQGVDLLESPERLPATHVDLGCPAHLLAISPDGRLAAAAPRGQATRLWNTATGREQQFPEGHERRVEALRFSPDGSQLAGLSAHRFVMWDVASRRLAAHWSDELRLIAVGFAESGRWLVTATMHGLQCWDTAERHPMLVREVRAPVRELACAPAGFPMAVHAGGHEILLLRSAHAEPESVPAPSLFPAGLAFSADGRFLATRESQQAALRLFDLHAGRWGTRIATTATDFRVFAFPPNNHRLLVTAGSDGRLRVWDTVTGLERVTYQWHSGPVLSLAFSSDARLLVTSGDDGIVKFWPWRKLLGA